MERPFTLDRLDHVVLRTRNVQRSIASCQMLSGEIRNLHES